MKEIVQKIKVAQGASQTEETLKSTNLQSSDETVEGLLNKQIFRMKHHLIPSMKLLPMRGGN